jgi:predicted flap endonuclease-1-like 5' DNA nuclease/archaellum component FlaC
MRFLIPILSLGLILGVIWMHMQGLVLSQPLLFPVSCAACLLMGYLLAADYVPNPLIPKLQQELEQREQKNVTLQEQIQALHKQAAFGVPHTEMEDLRLRLKSAEDERNRLQADFVNRAKTIATLHNRVDTLQDENEALKASSNISETVNDELTSLRDALSEARVNLKTLAEENDNLRDELDKLQHKGVIAAALTDGTSDFFVKGTGHSEVTSATVEPELEITNLSESIDNQSVTSKPFAPEPVAMRASVPSETPKMTPNNLQAIEGIGPKVEGILKDAGVTTWKILADTDIIRLRMILAAAGDEYRLLDPTSWAAQSKMLIEND